MFYCGFCVVIYVWQIGSVFITWNFQVSYLNFTHTKIRSEILLHVSTSLHIRFKHLAGHAISFFFSFRTCILHTYPLTILMWNWFQDKCYMVYEKTRKQARDFFGGCFHNMTFKTNYFVLIFNHVLMSFIFDVNVQVAKATLRLLNSFKRFHIFKHLFK